MLCYFKSYTMYALVHLRHLRPLNSKRVSQTLTTSFNLLQLVTGLLLTLISYKILLLCVGRSGCFCYMCMHILYICSDHRSSHDILNEFFDVNKHTITGGYYFKNGTLSHVSNVNRILHSIVRQGYLLSIVTSY